VDGIFTTHFVDPYLRFHKYIYEKSDGRIGAHSNRVPALLLTTIGRKSGLPRTNGLTYCRDRGDIIVVASNGGSDRSPAWLLNLEANPSVTIRLGRCVVGATAQVATPEDRSQLWPLVNRSNRGMSRIFHRGVRGRYDVYQRATSREIPIVIITPERGALPGSLGRRSDAERPEVSRAGRAAPVRSGRKGAGS
jgi:deazaflavin-dependent oxidoreductase (nitroreductase family)